MRILLRDLTPGTDYNIQLRANDGQSVSDWSRIFNLTTIADILPPAPPQNVTWVVNRTAFSGKWDAVTQNEDATPLLDFSHYIARVTSDTASVEIKTTNTFYDLPFETNKAFFITPKATLSLTVFAVDTNGNRSVASATVSATNPPPPDPTGVAAAGIVGGISMKWDVQEIDDLEAYDVFMSTSDSGFTPTSGNRVYSGTGNTLFYDSSSLGVTHYFKIRSRDVFNSISNYVTVSATPISPTDVDTTSPGVPTGLAATMAVDSNDSAFATAAVSWTAPADTDLAGYVVRYKQNASSTYDYVNVPVGTTSITIGGLVVGVQYNFSVQSYDRSTNRSAFTTAVNATAANTAPSTPAAPTASTSVQSTQVNHAIQKAAGGRLESDVAYLEVHLGTTSTFTASDSTLIGQLQVESGSTFVSEVFPTPANDTALARWVRVIAVDRGGLKSAASAVAAVTVGLINNANIANATITSAKINDLDANKITAGTGIINSLLIKAGLTVDTAGLIKSSNYVADTSGYQLSNNTLEINQGTIKAAALQLQDSANIIPVEYADFEFQPTWYTGKIASYTPSGTITWAIATAPEITSKFGTQALKITKTGTDGVGADIQMSSSITNYNINVEPNSKYIFSAWVYNATGSGAKDFELTARLGDGTYLGPIAAQNLAATSAWTRIAGVINTNASTTMLVYMTLKTAGTIYVDGLQVERQQTALTTPSPWRAPSTTVIDGGIIRTGEIRSTALANGLSGQPAWSINLTGGAQFGDATVRGRIVVGDPTNPSGDGVNSRIHSANYLAGTTGWIIRNDGYAEFRQLAVNSIKVTAMDAPMQNNTYAKLYDYMQDGNLWVSSGAVLQKTDSGAYSAESLFEFTGTGLVLRNAVGVTKVAFDPTILYRVSARIRAYDVATLNANPGFEVDTSGWFSYGTNTIARDTTKFFSGVASMRWNQAGTSNGVYGAGTVVNVKAGRTYTFNARVLPNNVGIRDNLKMNIIWKNSLGEEISTTFNDMAPPVDESGVAIPIDGTTWIQFSSTGTAPVGAVTANFELQAGVAGVAIAGIQGWFDDVRITTPPRVKVGVFGFDNSNNIIDWNYVDNATTPTAIHPMPTNAADLSDLTANQYMMVANEQEVQIASGDASTTSDWITVTGYLRGRGGSGVDGLYGSIGEAPDQYKPASVNQSVRYLVPYVEFDIATGSKAQLDQFSVEAYESGAPAKIATAPPAVGVRSVSIENINDGTEFDHALRFSTGVVDEMKSGLIGMSTDDDWNDAGHLRIAPPMFNNESTYDRVWMGVYDRNPNYLGDSSFERGIDNWVNNAATPGSTISWDEVEGYTTPGSLKITTNGTPVAETQVYGRYDVYTSTHPDLVSQRVSVSGWFKANAGAVGRNIRLYLNCHDDTGAIITSYYLQKVATADWQKIAWTMPVAVADNTAYCRYFWWWNNAVAGDTIWVDEVQFETGGVSFYRPASASAVVLNTDVVRSTGSILIANGEFDLSPDMYGGGSRRRDTSAYPGVGIQTDGGSTFLRNVNYPDTYGNRVSTQLSHYSPAGTMEAAVRIYGADDDRFSGQIAITNTTGGFALNTYAKEGETMETAKNVRIGGHLDIQGEPDWIAMTLLNGFVEEPGAYQPSYHYNGGTVFLRGLLKTATKGSPTPFATLPSGYRPAQTIYLPTVAYNSVSTAIPCVIVVNSSGSCYWYASSNTTATATFLLLDSLSFSTSPEAASPPVSGDTTAPGTPSGFSINAYSSGSTTGTYQLKWTNPSASDTKGVKIIWRTDRYPTVTIAGSGVKTLTTDGTIITVTGTASQAKSYNHAGIPVNKTIYYRVVSYDASGNHSTYVSASRYLLASPFTVNATDSDAYRLGYGGMWRNDGDAPYQGDWSENDNHRGLFFYGTGIYSKLSAGGVVRTPTKMTVYVQRQNTSHGNNAGVGLNLRGHTYTSKPSGDPIGGMYNEGSDGDDIVYLSRGESATVTIPSSWYNNFVASVAADRLEGVGCYGSTTSDYLVLYGKSSGSQHGRITVYHKG